MYVASVPNRNSPPAILLRESFRVDGKVRNRTLANLSHWPPAQARCPPRRFERRHFHRRPLFPMPSISSALALTAMSLPSSAPCTSLHLDRLIDKQPSHQRDLVLAMIVSRILEPASKLATSRSLHPDTLTSTLGELLHLDAITEDELYQAMDWLLPRRPASNRLWPNATWPRVLWCSTI